LLLDLGGILDVLLQFLYLVHPLAARSGGHPSMCFEQQEKEAFS
jgi:hypothetical protein